MVKERLKKFISYLGIGQAKFERECGLANGYVNNIRQSITPEKLQKIALRYPELNKGWLMTGDGEMISSNKQSITGDNNIQVGNNNKIDNSIDKKSLDKIRSLESQIDTLKIRLQDKDNQIDILQSQIQAKDAQIDKLLSIISSK